MHLVTAFLIGLLGSLHCVGMCGPIALALPIGKKSNTGKFVSIITYNFGRISTYAFIGVLLGALGLGVSFFGFQQYFSIAMGALIIVAALSKKSFEKIFEQNQFLANQLFKLKKGMQHFIAKRNLTAFFSMGLLNGLLPCGLVYFAVIGAITSYGVVESSLYMVVFGLGTLPAMLFIAFSPNWINENWRLKIRRALPYFAMLIGVLFILRGMNLGVKYLSPALPQDNDTAVQCVTP